MSNERLTEQDESTTDAVPASCVIMRKYVDDFESDIALDAALRWSGQMPESVGIWLLQSSDILQDRC